MKKKIFIGIGIVIALIVAIIGYFVYKDLKEENKLVDEINKIVSLTEKEEIDMNEINKLLDRIVTKGDYAIVEEQIKEYLKDSLDNIMVMYDILNDNDLLNILTAENYRSDGPNFVNTLKYINETIITLEDAKNKYSESLTEDKIMSYIESTNLDDYYKDLYKELAYGDLEGELNDKTLETAINQIIDMLETEEVIINFLIKNKNSWYIDGENIVFETDALVEEYNYLIGKL